MSQARFEDLPQADESLVRANAGVMKELADRYGVKDLRVASSGELIGHIPNRFDSIDIAEFELDAGELLGAEVFLVSDTALTKAGVSHQLLNALSL